MNDFTIHDSDSAPADSKPLLEKSIKGFGMIPNLHAVLAESPQLLDGYQTLHQLAQDSSFDKEELTVVWQTINVEHKCHYCVPAHTAVAGMMNVSEEVTQALRNQTPLPTEKLEVLRNTVLVLVRERGVLDKATLAAFYEAGFTKRSLLDAILILSQKVISNYVNHIAETPIDEPFKKFSWEK